ncbi:C-Jun-amino-terminal kinase-interacting protein 4 isoform X2 [Boleophthalmus pectinirostris]|uniref:C-Jun-amino-terminal kinase-interacting protein 4 isoform X2 n=1 Tax=Boleophthalmus pectinirostris TaxID=150288 RepID=UPI0024327179|nr:C-Jun-amino-terminal kinase-interacting protein 4 isoform X2 [Boleophthalmus pectinirostris]
MMEYNERVLCGSGEVELDPNIVSEEAGKLYAELQTVIELHGESVVESLVPIFVWVLEGLANCKSQLRDREEEANREKAEKEDLLERYQTEKTLRKESQERYLELDDQMEQERRAMRMREKERERREKQLESKAREQADQLVALEEQKTHLSRELSTLRHSHTKLTCTYREMLDRRKESERESPLRNHVHPKNPEKTFFNPLSESNHNDKLVRRPHSNSGPPMLEQVKPKEEQSPAKSTVKPDANQDQFINDIITSTPELAHLQGGGRSRISIPVSLEEQPGDTFETSMEDEIRKEQENEEESDPKEQQESSRETKEEDEEEEEESEDEELEFELRNTDSVFSELSELSRDYLESVDQGASVRGGADQFEEILSKYEELKVTHELVDAARKSLISRVVELTDDRSTLQLELSSLQETVARLDNRLKEKEEEIKRLKVDLEAFQSSDSDASVPASVRHFSRSEMARVVMEKNQYKQRLVELQDTMRSQAVRASREERLTGDKSSSVWKKFNRLLGLSKEPLIPPPSSAYPKANPPYPSVPRQAASPVKAESTSQALSPRVRRREYYREIRSHIWGKLGKRQIHGWSVPLANTQESQEPVPEPKDIPVLVKLRLLDQRDSTAKLNCAVAVPPEVSGEASCSVWVISGPASNSEITVIDPARPNTVLDQFTLPPTSPALCICAVPPIGNNPGTVWIGTQEGSVLVHSASSNRRRCLQSISFSEAVHSLTFTQNQVIAGLADGTLVFFSPTPGGWDLSPNAVMSLGSTPLQPIRCCLAKAGRIWVGYWNKVHVVDIENRKTEHVFTVSERSEQQVRFLCAGGSGVWTACRLDPILRLYDWTTGRPLQEVDFSALVLKTLGQAFLTLSPLQISSLSIICGRLWIGTGGGAIISIPLSITSEAVSIPYCSTASTQLCSHGHRQAVRFIIPAPSCLMISPDNSTVTPSQLIISGGEGYINFRIGDDANEESDEVIQSSPLRAERSHMFIWQISSASVPNPAL